MVFNLKKILGSSRGQVGIEFMMIIGAVMFFTTIFILSIQESSSDQVKIRESILLKDIALLVQNEINLASESSDGYFREFEIPYKAGNLNYNITIDNQMIYIETIPLKHALAIPCLDVTGNINKTQNTIKKISGVIYLNS